jgi:cellulose synthase/poly-beta-1,6-N-acetylglucosamine synthase-like glycosyltransferase
MIIFIILLLILLEININIILFICILSLLKDSKWEYPKIKSKLDLIIPVYNEEENILILYKELKDIINSLYTFKKKQKNIKRNRKV